jgi:hypothetical protein
MKSLARRLLACRTARRALRLVSVDVGIVHLAFVDVRVEVDGVLRVKPQSFSVSSMHLVDLRECGHAHVSVENCTLPHTKETVDRISHFLQDHGAAFDNADVVLIERQPPCGLCNVQDLLFARYRMKTQLVSPNKVHAFFGIGGLDYDARKVAVTRIARAALERGAGSPRGDPFASFTRAHDVADALCIAMCWMYESAERAFPLPRPSRGDPPRDTDEGGGGGGGGGGACSLFARFAYEPEAYEPEDASSRTERAE